MVAGEVIVTTFATRPLADGFRSRLMHAMDTGEEFDIATGFPVSMLPAKAEKNWLTFSTAYMAARWDTIAPKTRDSIADSLATAALAMVEKGANRPRNRELRRAFVWAILPSNIDAEAPEELAEGLRWLRERSRPLKSLTDPPVTREVVNELTKTLDDGKVAGDTYRRRRRGLNAAIEYAVESKDLDENPLHHVKSKRVASDDLVDPRVVINHAQARELLTAMSYVGSWHRGRGRRLVAFFGTLYYAGVRPAEAVALREKDCYLPQEG
ncbi:MAG TPA: hypothetical protein VFI65_18855 [Streptosporangiaceae bacterium]|nr:hypothetical protein [Streptosporangiaceae bacterium]